MRLYLNRFKFFINSSLIFQLSSLIYSSRISSKHARYAADINKIRVLSKNLRLFVFKLHVCFKWSLKVEPEARALLLIKFNSMLKILTVKMPSCLNFPATYFVQRQHLLFEANSLLSILHYFQLVSKLWVKQMSTITVFIALYMASEINIAFC